MKSKTMNPKTILRKSLTASIVKACLATALTLGIGSYSAPTHAQWWTQDNSAILKAVKEYAEQAKRWTATLEQYKGELTFWQDMSVKLQGLSFETFTLQNQFKRVPDDYGMADECPGVTGGLAGDITSALSSFVPNMGGDVIKQQRTTCQLIVQTKNHKYNATVDYLQSLAQALKDLATIADERARKVGTQNGQLQGVIDDTNRYKASVDTAEKTWRTEMTQSDAQIQMLMQVQSNLARRAMNGQPSPLGTLVNVAAMKVAFGK
nr:hypothetical protein [Luteibacter rhizovicinus]